LREQDIHKIVDVFNKQLEVGKYSRIVPIAEIEGKEYNLNIPRYIDGQEPEDIQDIEAHLRGGIPNRDIDALDAYWRVCPSLKNTLFEEERPGYSRLKISAEEIKPTIQSNYEFVAYKEKVKAILNTWKERSIAIQILNN
jgi:type I restriction enzyme M protein